MTTTDRDQPARITIDAPVVPYPGGRSHADYIRSYADKIEGATERGAPLAGRNLTETVVDLLRRVATAMDAPPGTGLLPVDSEPVDVTNWEGEVVASFPPNPALAIANEVLAERARQTAKHGDQSHLPDGTGPDVWILGDPYGITAATLASLAKNTTDRGLETGEVTFLDILLGEVMEAFAESDPAALRTELVQVSAFAQQWVEKIDRDTRRAQEVSA